MEFEGSKLSRESKLKLYIAEAGEILSGEATDIYFARTKEILEAKGYSEVKVRMEFHAYSLPKGYKWAVFAGLEEALRILEGKQVDVWALPEGTVFREHVPLMVIEGKYSEFGVFETPILGVLRHATSMATKAARIKKLARNKTVLFFGLRCIHPALFPMADKYAYMGGCDGVSGVLAEKYIGVKPMGTMPHALILVMGGQEEAWKAFDEVMPPEVPRIALADTLDDEREEALRAARLLGERLYGVRFDTPSSRRGDMKKIVEEARWTLDLNGYTHVKIFVSGGVGEKEIVELRSVADGFGVGTSIAFPKSVDLSADIVEVFKGGKWIPFSKKGKWPGMKQAFRCKLHLEEYEVKPFNSRAPKCRLCRGDMEPLLKLYLKNGELVEGLPSLESIREYVLQQLNKLSEPEPL